MILTVSGALELMHNAPYKCNYYYYYYYKFTGWWTDLVGENVQLSLQDIVVGIPNRNDLMLNYLIVLGKISIWESRRNNYIPKFIIFLYKVETKRESENCIATRNKKLLEFTKRWEPLL